MTNDLRPILDDWPYDDDETVRVIRGGDGRRKLQVRLPLGIEQYELDGRPDGRRPLGWDSVLAYWEDRLATYRRRKGTDDGFVLPRRACADLREEAMLYYYRYVLLYQLGEYGRCARDTARNLRCLDVLARYGAGVHDRLAMEQYRPYLLRMHRASRALLALRRRQYRIALREVAAGVRAIRGLPERSHVAYRHERKRSLKFLKRLRDEIRRRKPLSLRQKLRRELREAVETENYELAATLRDRLDAIEAEKS